MIRLIRTTGKCCIKLTLLFFMHWVPQVKAQLSTANHTSPVPLSPQAASLFKYINIPVDYSRGLVPINIPLYTIKVGDLELPISLTYHSSGIKVHEPNSVVGLGWSLQAEPQLSRIVNGLPDEQGFLTNSQLGSNLSTHLWALSNGSEDEQPDEFGYSLLSNRGKFYYSRKPGVSGYTFKTVPYDPIKVDDSIYGFWNLTDDKGVKHLFGRTVEYMEMDNLGNSSSWKAISVTNSNQTEQINFSYHPKDFELLMYRTLPVENYLIKDLTSSDANESFGDMKVYACTNGDAGFLELTPPDIQQSKIHVTKYNAQTTYSQEYSYEDPSNPITIGGQFAGNSGSGSIEMQILTIKEITFNGGKVVFEKGLIPGTQHHNKAINRIMVYNYSNKLIKEIKFDYQEVISYGSAGFNQARFFLKKVRVLADSKEEVYSLDYDPTVLPYYNTRDIDLWGYYNGYTGNTELMPPVTVNLKRNGYIDQDFTFGTANRNPQFIYAQAGILTKITYPTGISSSFGYESNQALDQNNQPVFMGGLRVNSINDGNVLRLFKYGKNESGGGYVKNWVYDNSTYNPYVNEHRRYEKVNFVAYNHQTQCWAFGNQPVMVNYRYRRLSSQPIFDINYKGVSTVYPEVTEYINDTDHGKVVYNFRLGSFGNSPYSSPMYINGTTIAIEGPGDWKYGSQISSNIYKGNAPYQLIKHQAKEEIPQEFTDVIWSRKIYPTTQVLDGANYSIDVQQNEVYYQLQDDIKIGYLKVLSDTTIDYHNAGNTTAVKQYAYTNPLLPYPTEEVLIGSDQIQKKIKKYFPNDLVTMGNTVPYQEMVNRNQLSVPVIEEYYVGSALKQKHTTEYQQGWDNNYILPAAVKNQQTGYAEQTRIQLSKYDIRGNLVEFKKDGLSSTSHVYGYIHRNPFAEFHNSPSHQVQHINFEEVNDDFEGNLHIDATRAHTGKASGLISNGSSSEVVSHGRRIQVNLTSAKRFRYSGWIYSDGPSTQIFLFMLRAGEPGYYSYVDNVDCHETGRWVYVSRDVEVPGDVAELYLRLDNNGGGNAWFDDLAIRPSDSEFSSYTYEPLVGMTSMIDTRGQTTYYDYDGFQRLRFIRDQDGNIIKSYCYNYAGQNVDCNAVPTPPVVNPPTNPGGPTNPPTSTCSKYRIFIPNDATNNLYISYQPCESSGSVTVALSQLPQMLDIDGVAVEFCIYGNSGNLQFRYGQDGPAQLVSGITVSSLGACN